MVGIRTYATANRGYARRRKKKCLDELRRLFPARFGKGAIRNQLEQLRKFLLAKADAILDEGEKAQDAYKAAFALMVGQHKPACFSGKEGNILTSMEKGFEKLLVALEESGCANTRQLTVFEFYVRLESLEEKYEAQKPKNPPNGKR